MGIVSRLVTAYFIPRYILYQKIMDVKRRTQVPYEAWHSNIPEYLRMSRISQSHKLTMQQKHIQYIIYICFIPH